MKKPLVLILLSGLFITISFAVSYSAHAASLELYSTPFLSDSSLISYYRLESNSNDAKGSNNGSDTSVSYGSSYGKFGEGAHFGGSGYILVGNNLGITGGTITLSGWIKIGTAPASGTYYTLYAQSSATEKIEYTAYYTDTSGTYQMIFCRVRRGTFADCSTVNYTLTPGTWYHVALTYDGATVTGYVDGVAIGTVSSTGTGSVTPSDVFAIGMDDSSGIPVDLMGNGSMDDVAIFSRALSAGEIADLYDGSYYAQIENTADLNLRDGTSTSANILKTLPAAWIVKVTTMTDSNGPIVNDGYRWYGVIDPTDNVTGWMAATDTTSQYISSYDGSSQAAMAASSSAEMATGTTPQANFIVNAIDHYYNDTNTTASLYSSNDGSNTISSLKTGGFPEEVIPGIAAVEDGGFSFDNEDVSFDYGHGIMQLTLSAGLGFDNRGIASGVTIPPCALASNLYTNCYSAISSTTGLRYYEPYGGTPGNPEYKQYTNTSQSIYANIKDGLQVLANKYAVFSGISTSTTISGTTYSAADRQDILATESYNGSCGYAHTVANALDNITSYFPNATTSGITDLISKLHTVGQNEICAQLHSPATLIIQDSAGRTVGIANGNAQNDFPFAVYDPNGKWAKVLAAGNGNYTFKVIGAGTGTYGFDFTIKHGSQSILFSTKNMPVVPHQMDTYTMDVNAIMKGQNGVTLRVDTKGDGMVDKTLQLSGASVVNMPIVKPPPLRTIVVTPPRESESPPSTEIEPPLAPILIASSSTNATSSTNQ
jgi:hypothetical protein